MSLQQQAISEFEKRFGSAPQYVVRAPGRVNLIGEHTDYNDGFVLPMAINRATWVALSPTDDGQVTLYSIDFDEMRQVTLADFANVDSGWFEYIKGTLWVLQDAGHKLSGWQGVIVGDVPVAAGLSSSASVELAIARASAAAANLTWDPATMARLAQRAENEWVGMNCGIMDQMISAAGIADTALLIDCRSLETENVPLPAGTVVVVLDTATRRGLVDSAYNERRAQCEAAARFFGVSALRDVTLAEYEARAAELDDLTRRRARHVIAENERTLAAAAAMKAGDAVTLGQLMNASHVSLRDDFEVSAEALNVMVDCALEHSACYGARMTGAGFGGCAVALVREDVADDFAVQTSAAYEARMQIQPNVYICQSTNGAEVLVG